MPVRSVRISVFADTTAFGVIALTAITIPVTFSTAQAEVFALPKTILAISLATVLAALLFVRWVGIGRPIELPRSALAVALGVFIVWNCLAAWLAIDPAQALFGERLQYQGLVPTVAYTVFAVSAWATVNTTRRRTVLLVSVTVGAIAVSTYALLQRVGLDPIWHYLPYGRVFSTIGQANSLAAYIVMTVPLTLALAVGSNWLVRMVVVAVVIVMLCALALTLSRGGYLGLLTVAVVLLAAGWSSRRAVNIERRRVGVAVLAALALIGMVLSIPDLRAISEQVAARAVMTADLSEGSIRGHFDMWTVAVAIIADHPIVGTGQDTYALLFGDYRDALLSPDRALLMSYFRPESPHNVYLAIAQGAGIPALVAYLALITAAVHRILLTMRSTDDRGNFAIGVLLAAIAGHLVTDTFMTAETAGSVLFWIVLGISAGLAPIGSPNPRSGSGHRG